MYESIEAASSAVSEIPLLPVAAKLVFALLTDASITFAIVLDAIATPTETETAAVPAKEKATETAPAIALIVDVSDAPSAALAALIPLGVTPLTCASDAEVSPST